jgi:hypothetical protein
MSAVTIPTIDQEIVGEGRPDAATWSTATQRLIAERGR